MVNLRSIRSPRALLAIVGIGAAALGISQSVGTQAALTDTANASVDMIATGNFYPTPLTAAVTCSTTGSSLTARRVSISWTAVPGATGYYVQFVNKSGGAITREDNPPASQTSITGVVVPHGDIWYAYVYTKNGPATSSGYTAAPDELSFKDWVSSRTECQSFSSGTQATSKANQTWENQTTWTPGSTPPPPANFAAVTSGVQAQARVGAAAPTATVSTTTAPPTTTPTATTTPSATTTPAATAVTTSATPPVATTTATPTTTTPPATEAEAEAEADKTKAEKTAESAAATTRAATATEPVTATVDLGKGLTAKLSTDGTQVVVSNASGEVCSAKISPAERILTPEGDGTLSVSGNGGVRNIDTTTCAIS